MKGRIAGGGEEPARERKGGFLETTFR